jgi:hypothetical protein
VAAASVKNAAKSAESIAGTLHFRPGFRTSSPRIMQFVTFRWQAGSAFHKVEPVKSSRLFFLFPIKNSV